MTVKVIRKNLKEYDILMDGKRTGFVLTKMMEYITERTDFFEMFDRKGFSISTQILDKLDEIGVKKIRIIKKWPTRRTSVYVLESRFWRTLGEPNIYGSDDDQLFVPIINIRDFGVVCE
jgi:hypothetical protein